MSADVPRRMPLDGAALLERADRIATRAHRGQSDKAGAPYIGHPLRVARRVADRGGAVEHQAAALLHDVLEDTTVTVDELRREGLPEPVIRAVIALTKHDGESYEQAVQRAAADPIARVVKRCDVEDNADPDRLALLDAATRQRLEAKYTAARAMLDTAEEEG
jgi:(p)ppGpp synthase/HD superfamily hydrolase